MSNERLFFRLSCSVNADAIRFIHNKIKIPFFDFFFLEPRFLFNH